MKVLYKGEEHYQIKIDTDSGMVFIVRPGQGTENGKWVPISEVEEYHPPKHFIFFPKNDFEKHIGKLCDELKETLIKKNRDYGDSFSKLYGEYGDVSTAIRLSDKLDRFKNLIEKDNLVKDESKDDTLKDLAGYSVLTLAIKRMR